MQVDTSDRELYRNLRNFVFEAGQLRMERRNGWHHLQVSPESVSEHCHRGSMLAYFVASLAKEKEQRYSNIDPNYVVTLFVFHEMTEQRLGDDDAIQKRYMTIDTKKVLSEQTESLGTIGTSLKNMWLEVDGRETPSGSLAKDVDYLEMAFSARELVVKGHQEAQKWVDVVGPKLESEVAKEIFAGINNADPNEWWKKILKYPLVD